MSSEGHSVLLAGVGGDAHFVGLTILRASLERVGFNVIFLGAQNHLDRLCQHAQNADVVLVSNMDGHARYYLEGLREAQREYDIVDRLWYLGGYPSLDDHAQTLSALAQLGFDRVFHGYIDTGAIIDVLSADLSTRHTTRRTPAMLVHPSGPQEGVGEAPRIHASPAAEAWSPEVRDEVLSTWYTGDLRRTGPPMLSDWRREHDSPTIRPRRGSSARS